jgi:hypothetical protein
LPNHGAETPAEPREIHIVVRLTTHGGGSTAGKVVQEVGVDAMRGRVLENAKEGKKSRLKITSEETLKDLCCFSNRD